MYQVLKINRIVSPEHETRSNAFLYDYKNKIIFSFVTLELPYRKNQSKISCIKSGMYVAKVTQPTTKIPYIHITLEDRFGRVGICMHIGNYCEGERLDSEGCILVGLSFADLNNDGFLDITFSKSAMLMLLKNVEQIFLVEILE